MIRISLSVVLSSLILLGVASESISAKPSDMRNAYEDGWKWYVHRKSAGAEAGELLDILKTLKKKYGHTYFNLERVDRALDELDGTRNVSAPPAENFPELDSPALAMAVPVPPEAAPEAPKTVVPMTPAPSENKEDPFERYMAAQQAKVKSQERVPPAIPAQQRAAPPTAVSAASLTNPAARVKIEELSSPDEMVKVKAARALGDMREPGAIGPLINLLEGDSTFVSMSASAALAKIGKPAVQPVINALRDANPNVRIGACVALGDMSDPAIGPALQKAALDGDSRVRRAAATALNKSKSGK